MKKRLLAVLACFVVLVALMSATMAMAATCATAVWCTSDQWGQTSQFTPFILYNNIWGATSGQTIFANSVSDWGVTANFPETGGVKTYPNASLDMSGKNISNLGSCTSSFNVSLPSSGSYSATYDLWVPSEIMIWMSKRGLVSPIAHAWNSDGTPVPVATNVNVGGHIWNVYRGGSNVVSFVRTTNTSSGIVDILAILNWTASQGWISNTSNLGSFQFGYEITSAPGGLTFNTNSYSMNCGGRGSGGGGPTPTRSNTPNQPVTPTRTNTPNGPTPTRTNTPSGPAPTFTRTPTPGGTGGACTPTSTISVPFTFDGSGTFCWQASSLGAYINSWNTNSVTVNGVNFTNVWVGSGSYPAKINNNYYVAYNSSVGWGHFEARP